MKRWIEESDCNRISFKCFIEFFKVSLLNGKNLIKSLFSFFKSVGANHFSECVNSVALKEHMLCTAKTDTFGSEFAGYESIAWRVGICADLNLGVFLSKVHD